MTKTKQITLASRPYVDYDDCLTAAVDDFIRRRKIARWRVSAQWADIDRESITIYYRR